MVNLYDQPILLLFIRVPYRRFRQITEVECSVGAWQGICSLAKHLSNIANTNICLVAISLLVVIKQLGFEKEGPVTGKLHAWVSFESISVVLWLHPVAKTYRSSLQHK